MLGSWGVSALTRGSTSSRFPCRLGIQDSGFRIPLSLRNAQGALALLSPLRVLRGERTVTSASLHLQQPHQAAHTTFIHQTYVPALVSPNLCRAGRESVQVANVDNRWVE